MPRILRRRSCRLAVAVMAIGVLATACLPHVSNGASTGPVLVNVGPRGNRPIDFADPFIAKFGDTYYGYSTSSDSSRAQVIKSADAVHWSWVGDAFAGPGGDFSTASQGGGGAKCENTAGAPGVVERPPNRPASRCVLYYTAPTTPPGAGAKPCSGQAV